jgi:hypothetical protein
MSDLFAVTILALDGATARVRFEVVHPDQWDVPATPNFALQVVTELYWIETEGWLWRTQPITRDEARQLATSHPRRAELERWLELAHGRRVEITEAEHDALERGVAMPRRENLAAFGFDSGGYYKRYRPDFAAFRAIAAEVVTGVRLEDARNHPRRAEDGPHPQATLVFTVADPALLAHLRVGLTWPSAMFDFEGW